MRTKSETIEQAFWTLHPILVTGSMSHEDERVACGEKLIEIIHDFNRVDEKELRKELAKLRRKITTIEKTWTDGIGRPGQTAKLQGRKRAILWFLGEKEE